MKRYFSSHIYTLKSKIVIGFVIITLPLLIILICNNWYAMKVVCDQVAASNKSIVQIHSNQVDNVLSGMEKYLHSMAFQDQNIIFINSSPTETIEDYYANINILNKFQKDLFEYDYANSIFLYKTLSKELIVSTRNQEDFHKINIELGNVLGDPLVRQKLATNWKLFCMDGRYYILKLTDTGYDTYIGVWVNLDQLLKPIRFLELSDNAQVMFVSSDGQVLTQNITNNPLKTFNTNLLKKTLNGDMKPYTILKSQDDGLDSMIVSIHSNVSDLYLAAVLPVNNLLEKLTFFQRVIYVTPFVAAVFLIVFLFYLQRVITSPIKKLLCGMEKNSVGRSDCTTRTIPPAGI